MGQYFYVFLRMQGNTVIRVFHKNTKLAILASEALLRETKKFNTSSEDWTWDLWFQVWHSPFWANLAIACKSDACRSWYSNALLILGESPRSKKWSGAWTEDRKGEYQTWNQRPQVQSSLEVTFCCWNFLFSCSKASDT